MQKLKAKLKISNTALTLLLRVLFWLKSANFLQKNADISKIKRALVLKGIFSETAYLRAKFQVSTIILTSFRRGNTRTFSKTSFNILQKKENWYINNILQTEFTFEKNDMALFSVTVITLFIAPQSNNNNKTVKHGRAKTLFFKFTIKYGNLQRKLTSV